MRPRLGRLRTRPDFLRVAAAGRKWTTPGLVLQAAAATPGEPAPTPRVGYTASRKVGSAVARNRAKRRLRAAAAEVLASAGRPGTDYVLIGRQATVSRPYALLKADLIQALAAIEQRRGRTP